MGEKSLVGLGDFYSARRCYITYVTCAVVICLICPHSHSGAARPWLECTYQANYSCPRYIYNMHLHRRPAICICTSQAKK